MIYVWIPADFETVALNVYDSSKYCYTESFWKFLHLLFVSALHIVEFYFNPIGGREATGGRMYVFKNEPSLYYFLNNVFRV